MLLSLHSSYWYLLCGTVVLTSPDNEDIDDLDELDTNDSWLEKIKD